MKKRSIPLFILSVFSMLMLYIGIASAQEIDISSLTEEQRTLLLIQLLQMQGTGNASAPTEIPTPTNTPIPTLIANPYENLTEEQRTLLLIQLLQMQGTGNASAPTETPTPISTPIPALIPDPYEDLTDEQLKLLLIQLLLDQQGSDEAKQTVDEIAPAVPTLETNTEMPENKIYELKKLIVEKLPEYMFIQPTTPSKPDKSENNNRNDNTGDKTPEPEPDDHGCPPGTKYECYERHNPVLGTRIHCACY